MKIGFIVSVRNEPNSLAVLNACLNAQTHQDFRAVALHNGPDEKNCASMWDWEFKHLPYVGYWGYPNIKAAIPEFTDCDAICLANGDGYYVPKYLQIMSRELKDKDMVLCDFASHYKDYGVFRAGMRYGGVDRGSFMVRTPFILNALASWDDKQPHSDWLLAEAIGRQGARIGYFPGILYIHN